MCQRHIIVIKLFVLIVPALLFSEMFKFPSRAYCKLHGLIQVPIKLVINPFERGVLDEPSLLRRCDRIVHTF